MSSVQTAQASVESDRVRHELIEAWATRQGQVEACTLAGTHDDAKVETNRSIDLNGYTTFDQNVLNSPLETLLAHECSVTVNEKYGFVDLVCKQVGRHANVGVLRLPDSPLLQLW